MTRRSRKLILMLVALLGLSSLAFAEDSSIIISGAQVSGAWTTGNITISFGDSAGHAYSETVSFGQYSTSASIASTFGAIFSRDYIAAGLCAHAVQGTIYFHLKGETVFRSPSITGTYTPFSASTSGWPAWPVTPALTWPTPQAIVYGTALSAVQLNASANTAGSFVYSLEAGTVPTAGSQALSVTFTPADTTDFATTTARVTLVVNQASPTITWALPAAITHGTALSAMQLNASASGVNNVSLAGTFVYTPSAGTVPIQGASTLSVTFTASDSTDYATATATQTITVESSAPIIQTVAGNGTGAYNNDGISALSAELNNPSDVAVDSSGNIYIADTNNNRIRMVTAATGLISTIAGTGTAGFNQRNGSASLIQLNHPTGIALDNSGNLYIADTNNELIRQLHLSSGTITTIAGNGYPTPGYLSNPNAPEVGTDGPATQVEFYEPTGVAVDSQGNVYIADTVDCLVRKVTLLTGLISTVAGAPGFGSPLPCGYAGDGGPATSAELNNPTSVAVDGAGNIYIADSENVLIRVVWASSGTITSIAGYGFLGSDWSYESPFGLSASLTAFVGEGLTLDPAGNVLADSSYITTYPNGYFAVDKLDTSVDALFPVAGGSAICSQATDSVGDGCPATNAILNNPNGITVDASGNIYIADSSNNRIRKLVSYAAGTPTITWAAPPAVTYGTPLSAVQLNASANVPGTFSYSPVAGTVLTAGQQTVSVTFSPTDSTNFSSVTASVSLIVNPATPLIAWATPSDISQGTALGGTQLNASAGVAGTYTYSPAAGAVLGTGPHVLAVLFSPSDSTDYSPASAATDLNVVPPPGVADTGTVRLIVNNTQVATANYGSASTADSVAAGLATSATGNSLVSVSAVDGDLYIQALATGPSSNYNYSLQNTAFDSGDFAVPSFLSVPVTGQLEGGASANSSTGEIYGYSVNYDGVGNVTGFSDSVMGTWNFASGYDNLNRLIQAQNTATTTTSTQYAGAHLCWSYDAFGNRTAQVLQTAACPTLPSVPAPTASFNDANQVDWTSTNSAMTGFTYDAAGNVTNDNLNQYLYDAEGRICAVADTPVPGFTTMTGYVYDADGNRVAKGPITAWSCDPAISGLQIANETDYVLGPSGEQLTELGPGANSNSTWQRTYVYAAGSLIATYDPDGLHFRLNDWLGTQRVTTDYAGVQQGTCTSLPFGDALSCSNPLDPHHFTGKERDVESENDYFGARYYASSVGRFTSPDWSAKEEPVPYAKLDDPQTLNLYDYMQNNPLSGADPDGHCDWCQKWANFFAYGAGHFVTDAELPKVLEADYQRWLNGPHISAADEQRIEGFNTAVTMAMVQNVGGAEAGLDEEIVAGESALAKAATGGIGPVLKGAAGVDEAVAEIESEGGTVIAREVNVTNSAGTARVDVVYKDASGNLKFGEAKNGPTAGLNKNQTAVYGAMKTEGAKLSNRNARGAGLPSSVGPSAVRVFKY